MRTFDYYKNEVTKIINLNILSQIFFDILQIYDKIQ